MGGGMDANICIACLRQVVAFAPKVINAPMAQSKVINAPKA
jgi:hypothetical protein